jgi:hypothetical protein
MVPRLRLERSKEMSERCEPPPEWRDRDGWHWVDSTRWVQPDILRWRLNSDNQEYEWLLSSGAFVSSESETANAWRYLAPVTPPATVAALVEALKHADLQLEYIDQRSPSGTTPAVRAQIGAALALYRGAGR